MRCGCGGNRWLDRKRIRREEKDDDEEDKSSSELETEREEVGEEVVDNRGLN